jgi:hypothetical protein
VLFFWRLWHHLMSIQNMQAPNQPLNRTRANSARAG